MTSSLQAKKSNDRRCPPRTKVGAREARALGDKTRTKKRLLRWSSKLVFVVWRGNAQQLNVPLGAAARPERTTAPFAILCGSEPTVHTRPKSGAIWWLLSNHPLTTSRARAPTTRRGRAEVVARACSASRPSSCVQGASHLMRRPSGGVHGGGGMSDASSIVMWI